MRVILKLTLHEPLKMWQS